MRGEAGAGYHLERGFLRCCVITGLDERQQWRLLAKNGSHNDVQSAVNGLRGSPLIALETHREAIP
jgi:hypothetical protein